jgi:hypothetical protein
VTNLVPHDIEEWMRTMERRYADLASRRSVTTAFSVSTPRWRSTLPSAVTTTSGTFAHLNFSVEGASPAHETGSPAFMQYITPGGEPRYQLDVDGLYYIKASIQWNGTAGTGVRKGHIFENATATPINTFEQSNATGNGSMGIVHTIYPFAAGEYFRIGAFQNSGGNLTVLSGGSGSGTDPRAASNLVVVPIGAYVL